MKNSTNTGFCRLRLYRFSTNCRLVTTAGVQTGALNQLSRVRTSTHRFLARPAAVELSAIGRLSPQAFAASRVLSSQVKSGTAQLRLRLQGQASHIILLATLTVCMRAKFNFDRLVGLVFAATSCKMLIERGQQNI